MAFDPSLDLYVVVFSFFFFFFFFSFQCMCLEDMTLMVANNSLF